MRVLDNIEKTTVEQAAENLQNQSKPVSPLMKFLMSAGVVAALAAFIYAMFYFMNNSGV